ncbi:hypothetical protein V5799_014943 [Amblyomma americanum]|uniref:Uncharacterized protein n=1 Tax=Amblyomma americanum TaxID=6943 RepID=A0AAQ4E1K2_AMBAM
MDAPQQGIVALSTHPRPRASRVTPGSQAASSRYHGVTHRKDSNRERVYAPTVVGASKRTTMDGLAEVQKLTDGVIVVPKGGVMSKLRVKGEDDETTTAPGGERHSRSSRGNGAKSGLKGATPGATVAEATVGATSRAGHKSGEAGSPLWPVVAADFTANESTATKSGTYSPSFGDAASGDSKSHSLNERHNRRAGGKLANRRRRRKRKPSAKPTSHSGSGSSSSGVPEESSIKGPGSAALEDLSVRDGHASMSIEVHRKASNTKAKDATKPRPHRRRSKKPRMLTTVQEKGTSTRSSEMPSKLQDSATSVGRDGSSSEAKHETLSSVLARTSTTGANLKFTNSKPITDDGSSVTSTTTKEHSASSNKRSIAPRNAIDSVPLDEAHIGTAEPGNGTTEKALSERREMTHDKNVGHPETSGYHDFLNHSAVVSTTQLYAAKPVKPELVERNSSDSAPEQVFTNVLPRSKHAGEISETNLANTAVSYSPNPEDEKFLDFNINLNDTMEDFLTESSTKRPEREEQQSSRKVFLTHSSSGMNEVSPVAVVKLKSNASSKAFIPVTTPQILTHSETKKAYDIPSWKQNFGGNDGKFSSHSNAVGGVTKKGSSATTISPELHNSTATANSGVAKAKRAATARSGETLHTEGKKGAHITPSKYMKPEHNDPDADSGSLLEMQVNFLSQYNRTQRAPIQTTREASASPTSQERSTDSMNHTSTSHVTSLSAINPHAGGAEWFRDGGTAVNSTTRKPVASVIPSSSAVPSSQGSKKSPSRGLEADDDDDDDDDDENEEEGTSSHWKASVQPRPTVPSIVIAIKAASAKVWRNSSTKKATPASTGQRRAEMLSAEPKPKVPVRGSGNTRLNDANGVLRLGGLLDLKESTAQSSQPASLVNNSETTKMPSHVVVNSTEGPIGQSAGKLGPASAPASHSDTAAPSLNHELSESTAPANASRSQLGEKQNSLLNSSGEGSVWRTIIPPKNGAASTTTAAAGLGVENYYDDSKNDTSVGSADASDGHSEPKLENRRIAGEIGSTTRKPGGKPDVFQTEYYYDDAPSSKGDKSIPADITEPGYGNPPEQEAIDDLFF